MDYVMALCESSTRTYRDGMQVETTAVTYAQTRSGIRVVMNTGDEVLVNQEGKNTLFRLVGDGGQIEFWGWETAYRLLNAEHPRGELFVPTPFPESAHQRHLEHMAGMSERGEPDYTIPASSLLALEICEGAYLSSRHRCKVTFPVDQFTPPAAEQGQLSVFPLPPDLGWLRHFTAPHLAEFLTELLDTLLQAQRTGEWGAINEVIEAWKATANVEADSALAEAVDQRLPELEEGLGTSWSAVRRELDL